MEVGIESGTIVVKFEIAPGQTLVNPEATLVEGYFEKEAIHCFNLPVEFEFDYFIDSGLGEGSERQ